jgi:hypothetical protein
MNRHDRRAAVRRGCWATYSVPGVPVAHAARSCDGTCRSAEWRTCRSAAWLIAVIFAALVRMAGPGGCRHDAAGPAVRQHDETGELRPGWIAELPPAERWQHDQESAWAWALHCRSADYGFGLPDRLEDEHRRALHLVRVGGQAWARQLAALDSGPRRPERDAGPPLGLYAALLAAITSWPHTGRPLAAAGIGACA